MLVDGKKIAADVYAKLKEELAASGQHPCLTVFTCGPNAETRKYLELKKKRAGEVGIDVLLIEMDAGVSTKEAVAAIATSVAAADGVIVQLPFPSQVDPEELLAAIPNKLDVDAIHYQGEDTDVLPPVVGAISEIAKRHEIDFRDKKVVVVGQGRLVGKPAAWWAKAKGAMVTVVDRDTKDPDAWLREADIIISGAGQPGLITPGQIKEGVIVFDAGTTEEGGQLKGDVDPACAEKASLFTPVPGGIGPITIAILLKNLVTLYRRNLE